MYCEVARESWGCIVVLRIHRVSCLRLHRWVVHSVTFILVLRMHRVSCLRLHRWVVHSATFIVVLRMLHRKLRM